MTRLGFVVRRVVPVEAVTAGQTVIVDRGGASFTLNVARVLRSVTTIRLVGHPGHCWTEHRDYPRGVTVPILEFGEMRP